MLRTHPRFQALSRAASAITMMAGALVLAGWLLDIDALKSILPGWPSMKPNTAVGVLLAGLALWLLQKETPATTSDIVRRRLARACTLAVVLLSTLTLAEYLFGWDLALDRFLFKEPLGAAGTVIPGRMAPNTALSLLAIGCALWLLSRETSRGYRLAQLCGVVAAALGMLALFGYTYGVESLSGLSAHSHMALPTALTLVVLAAGLLLARPDRGLMRIFSGEGTGGVMARRLVLPILVVPVALDVVTLAVQRTGLLDARTASMFHAVLVVGMLELLALATFSLLERTDTQRKRAEKALRQRGLEILTLADNAADMIVRYDTDLRHVYCSAAVERQLGVSARTLIGKTPLESTGHREQAEFIDKSLRHVLDTGQEHDAEQSYPTPSGSKHFLTHIVPERDEQGKIQSLLAITRDITERKRAEEALRESETLLREAQHLAHIGSWQWTAATDTVKWSEELCRITGRDPARSAPSYAEMSSCFTPESWKRLSAEVAKTLQSGESYELDLEMVRPDGTTRLTSARGRADHDASGKIVGLQGTVQDITERQQSDVRLRTMAEMLDAAPSSITVHDTQGRFLFANRKTYEIHGYDKHELMALNLRDVDVPESAALIEERMRVIAERGEATFEVAHFRKDHTKVPLEIFVKHVEWEGAPALLSIATDITERKQAEAELIKLHRAVESSGEVIFLTDHDGIFTYVNPMFTDLYGYAAAEVVGQATPRILKSGVMKSQDYEGFWKTLLNGQVVRGELVNKTKDGRLIDVEGSANPILDGRGGVVGFLGVQRDITRRKRAAAALLAREAYLQAIMNNVPYLMWLKDREGRFLAVNDLFARSCGRQTAEDVIGKTDLDVWPVDLANKYLSDDAEVMATLKQKKVEEPIAEQSGIRWVETFKTPILDASGESIGTTGTAQDITERKQAELTLRESEAALAAAQRLGQIGSWSWDAATDTTSWSDEHYRIFGCDRSTPAPNLAQLASFFTEESRARLTSAIERAMSTGEAYDLELEVVRPDGTRRWIIGQGEAHRDAAGHVLRLRGTAQDITDRRRLENQFQQAQKMEAVGRLAGGVAHDFNNLLTAILGYSDLVLEELKDHPLAADVHEIRRAGERAKGLTQQLLAFSRRQIVQPRVLNVNNVLRDLEKMLGRLIGEDVALTLRLQPGIQSIRVDPGQIEQVIMNLAVNARDAMPTGGALTVETADVTLDKDHANQVPAVASGLYVMVKVSDTGCGMTPEVQQHLFEPFFTTKEPGKGTGLGLATVYGIVKQSGGYVWVSSEVGHGTTFSVYFPVVSDGAEELSSPKMAAGAHKGTETILVVEDNDQLRDLASRTLRREGYTVLVAADGNKAISIALAHDGPIHLMFTDVVMPGLSGREAFDVLVARKPGLKVLYTTGYTDDAVVQHGVIEDGFTLLLKPYTPAVLIQKVRQALDAPPQA